MLKSSKSLLGIIVFWTVSFILLLLLLEYLNTLVQPLLFFLFQLFAYQ